MRFKFGKKKSENISFEDSLGEEWSRDLDVVEVPLGNGPFVYLGIFAALTGLIFFGRILYLSVLRGEYYAARAEANVLELSRLSAPRGIIYARDGSVLAENKATFWAILNQKEFLSRKDLEEETLSTIERVLFAPRSEVWRLIAESVEGDLVRPVVLSSDLSQGQLVELQGANLPTIEIRQNFNRVYGSGRIFSSVIGYIGRVGPDDLKGNSGLSGEDFMGRGGVESYYDNSLRGTIGLVERKRDARGVVLEEKQKSEPASGEALRLTVDPGLQEYFFYRLESGLAALGRRVGVGLAFDPRNGEVLALVNLPGFDSNLFVSQGRNDEKLAALNSKDKPLFNRAVGGAYSPGSTIKPLVAVAALKEGVVNLTRKIFSAGYIDIPNPYKPDEFTRYEDWRYQGSVSLRAAIAQSSNVYFYAVGGGLPKDVAPPEVLSGGDYIGGLGISRLHDWWQKFLLGKRTGIDLPGEVEGLLPTPQWKEEQTGTPWLLGDTYNVSIGQGDLLVTPLQLLGYISAIANGGRIWGPHVNMELEPKPLADLSGFASEIKEVKAGMREAVTSPMGTAYLLHDLGFSIGAKTGTVQVRGGAQENAIFVGFAPFEKPEIAILILVENAVEGSLNTVPIAKDVLNWYYWNRIRK